MPSRIFFAVLAMLALISLSCGVSFDLPVDKIVTGPLQTEEISIPAPSGEVDLTLKFGAGEFTLSGGASNALVSGTARYNVADFKPEIETNGERIMLQTGNLNIEGIPDIGGDVVNEWDLKLGQTPMALTISAGAFKGDFDLGGLALTDLEMSGGASDVRLDFSAPNLAEMRDFRYSTGASTARLSGLANANFERMLFRSGLGDYTLDFDGQLQRDADVTVETGVSQVTVVIPQGMNVRVIVNGALSNVDLSGAWQQSGSEYTLLGAGPLLLIHVQMGAGNLELRAR
jgi:hypothetical protein